MEDVKTMNCRRTYRAAFCTGQAFSLVELALALGVFSFAIVGIMGLLPVGMTCFRESKARMVESSILQQRSSEILQTPFGVLTSAGSNTAVTGLQFYSEEGTKLGGIQPATDSVTNLTAASFVPNAVFASRVAINPSLDLGAQTTSTNVVRAIVEITRISTPGRALRTPIYVPNLGK